MKKLLLICFGFGISAQVFAKINIEVTSLTNTANNAVLEACGTAIDDAGAKTLLVTVKHDLSYYTTLTDAEGHWCTLIRRWTYDGQIDVSASALLSNQHSEKITFLFKNIKNND